MSLLELCICVVERVFEGMYVFYGMSGATVEFGLMETGMEKSCLDVYCVRIWANKLSLGLCLGLCLYFVNHMDDLNTDSNGSVIYGSHCGCPPFILKSLKKEPDEYPISAPL